MSKQLEHTFEVSKYIKVYTVIGSGSGVAGSVL